MPHRRHTETLVSRSNASERGGGALFLAGERGKSKIKPSILFRLGGVDRITTTKYPSKDHTSAR